MSEEKPLHVRVAEALGCRLAIYNLGDRTTYECGCAPERAGDLTNCRRYPHGQDAITDDGERYGSSMLPLYDTDWAATGPLIERFKLDVWCSLGGDPRNPWASRADFAPGEPEMRGSTPLVAVCWLIVALAQDGKLEALGSIEP